MVVDVLEKCRVKEGDYPAGETPLETSWTVWYDRKSLNKQESDAYVEGLHPLGHFNTIEGFYSNYAYLMRPHDLPADINIHLFRKGFKPMWEEFPDGGCWSMRLQQRSGEKDKVDTIWENIILALIGEQYEMPDVVGCVLSRRSQFDMISVWNMTHSSANTFKIGETTKLLVGLRETKTFMLTYKSFMDAMRDFSTYRNAKGYKFGNKNTMTPMLLAKDAPKTPPLPPSTPEKKKKKKKKSKSKAAEEGDDKEVVKSEKKKEKAENKKEDEQKAKVVEESAPSEEKAEAVAE